MSVDDRDFELLAAALRADAGDLKTFLEVLADKLAEALPAGTTVERGGFFGKKRVRRIAVELGDNRYELAAAGERLEPSRAKSVRGIVLKREPLPLEAWIEELSRELAAEAARSEQARLALERLLGI